jgi:hypothetical protein
MAGEQTNTQQTTNVDVATIINAALSGGSSSAVGQQSVYLGGTSGTRAVKMKRTGQTVNIPVPKITTIQEANSLYLNDPKVRSNWIKTMNKYGLETGNPLIERKAWETAVAGASDWYTTSGGTAQVTPEQYLQWWAGGQRKEPAVPTRQVYQPTTDQIEADINALAAPSLGREITDADKSASWYKNLLKGVSELYGKGTVTTVKEVKNPQTGKVEKLVTQTPGFSKEQVTEKITTTLEEADPISAERKKNLELANWAFKKMGGGQNG